MTSIFLRYVKNGTSTNCYIQSNFYTLVQVRDTADLCSPSDLVRFSRKSFSTFSSSPFSNITDTSTSNICSNSCASKLETNLNDKCQASCVHHSYPALNSSSPLINNKLMVHGSIVDTGCKEPDQQQQSSNLSLTTNLQPYNNVSIGINKMGLIAGKPKSCQQSSNPCACSCINCSFYTSVSSSTSPPISGTGCHYRCCGFKSPLPAILPDRTTAFSGHPFYSCVHQKNKVNRGDNLKRWFTTSSKMCDRQLRGSDLLKESKLNKDLAFTMRERDALGIKGLLPPAIRGQELQAKAVMQNIRGMKVEMSKYMFLRDLQDNNERLFYRVLCEHTEELMPVVYTPIVGLACQNYSHIYKKPRGLYLTVHDAGHISQILGNWPEKDVKAIVVTDGERILGLGDLGANGMGIPVGKLALYTALAGIPPYLTLPITIDVGTNNESLLNDPLYIGLKQKRTRGPQYDDLIDEFMEAVIKRWGRSCLIQFEDFGNSNAFRLLEKYAPNFCTFNDDIQGTASVTVAGILASCKNTSMKLSQHTFLFFGAGEAALGTAELLVMAMEQEGLNKQDARNRIWLMDSRGLITVSRGDSDHHKLKYAKEAENTKELERVVEIVKPSVIIGVAAQPGAFNEKILKKMASYNKRPLIFPLSNPTSKAECTAEEAYKHTEGRCIFASGSPFDAVKVNGNVFHPGQGNNAYIFPGVSLAVMACGVHHIPNETFLVAARALADQVTKEHFAEGRLFPPLETIREVSLIIGAKVSQYFYVESLSTVRPEPEDKLLFMRGKQYDYTYDGNGDGKAVSGSNVQGSAKTALASNGLFTN